VARARAARVPGLPAAGVLLGRGEPQVGRSVQYPLLVEQILHAAGVSCTPMEDGAVMIRFPSTNGLCVSVPLSSQGCDELIRKLEEARAGQQVTPSDTVPEPSDDQPSAGPGESQ
jgi:hypothetical protein